MLEKSIRDMFKHEGKTVKIMGKNRLKTYKELYEYIEELQQDKQIKKHNNYLGDNVLAQNLYQKKYYLKDIDTKLIEKSPEDVFKDIKEIVMKKFEEVLTCS